MRAVGWATLPVMHVSYDRESNAAYIYLTEEELMPGRNTRPALPRPMRSSGGAPVLSGLSVQLIRRDRHRHAQRISKRIAKLQVRRQRRCWS